ncbi:MAG: RES family NAD+ phosphorylase [Nitrospira sp.]|nr:RES family NAD+ phosphorylase [Nitrospira sp.]
MSELLEELNIPERFWEEVAESLMCRTCGAPLDICCDVGTATSDEIMEDELWESWYDDYSLQFESFSSHIEKYPYLGALHPLGKEIVTNINKLSKDPLDKVQWFRARRVENSNLLDTEHMLPPNPMLVAIPEGRYNHFGQQVFYLSDTKESAAREILGKTGGLAWVQEFALKNITDIANLCKHLIDDPNISELLFGLAYTNVLAQPVERIIGWKPQYFVPRFIADCLKHAGYKGIIFRSPHHYEENLVLLEYENANIVPTGTPSIMTLPEDEDPHLPFGLRPHFDF